MIIMTSWKKSECKITVLVNFRKIILAHLSCFSGAFGVVHRCVERSTGNVFAAKFVNTPHPVDKETVRKEINLMGQMRHPKLVHLHDAFEDDDEMVMIYEL